MMNQLNKLLEIFNKLNESLSTQIAGVRSNLTKHIEYTQKATEDIHGLIHEQYKVIQSLSDQNFKLTEKCYAIEIIQLRLFSALAETNPAVHSKIVGEMEWILEQTKEQEHFAPGVAEYIHSLVGIKAESKPLLRLVPKRDVPPSDVEHP